MNRITAMFEDLRRAGRKGLVGFLTAGDPDLAQSETDLRTALQAGVDLLELGVPFSDPTADGPVIQQAGQRALAAGVDLAAVLALAGRLRRDFKHAPMILFSYANPMFRYGYEKLAADAARAGLDGVLAVDIPYEESAEIRECLDRHGLAWIPLVAPTTPESRLAEVLAAGRGFVYYIMVKGVTGQRQEVPPDVREHLAAIRRASSLPIAVGFGIGSGDQARAAAADADAVVVGSALVAAARAGRLRALVAELAGAVHAG
jgi:tryptophan synthase alpha chain